MQCLHEINDGYIVQNPQPDNVSDCLHILVNPTEISSEILNLTPVQGSQIGGAIILVWAIAFAYRAAIHALKTNESENQNE